MPRIDSGTISELTQKIEKLIVEKAAEGLDLEKVMVSPALWDVMQAEFEKMKASGRLIKDDTRRDGVFLLGIAIERSPILSGYSIFPLWKDTITPLREMAGRLVRSAGGLKKK